MEISRLSQFPLEISISGLTPNTDFVTVITDDHGRGVDTVSSTSNGGGDLAVILPSYFSNFDAEYRIVISPDVVDPTPVVIDSMSIVRPYVDVADIAPTPGDIPEYTKYERLARLMIDNIVGGFYYKELLLGLIGIDSNVLPVGHRANKLRTVFENGALIYDSDLADDQNVVLFTLTTDKTSVILVDDVTSGVINPNTGMQRSPAYDSIVGHLPISRYRTFVNGSRYDVKIEAGWPIVPQDIQEATKLLIEDMSCDAPNYWSKYVREYETKDYRVDFHRTMFTGTGNLLVDQILKRYWGQTLYDNVKVL